MILLTARNLTKTFPRGLSTSAGDAVEILRAITFEARAGASLAITGASGAGKSTLLHLLAGLERADAGEIKVGEIHVARASNDELAQWRARAVGFVFQAHRLLPDLTVRENVALPLMIAGVARRRAFKQAAEILERVGLTEQAEQAVGKLSGGEAQRAAAARALVHAPQLVLADEPTGNLDATNGASLTQLLTAYAAEHDAVVIIATHNPETAAACSEIWNLKDGELLRAK